MPTQEQGVIAARIIARTQVHIDDHQIPAYVGTEIRYKTPFDPHNSRMPDVSVQLSDGPTVKKGAVLGMPDLAVEILSPDDDPDEVRQKAHYYLHNGSQIAWLIFPDSKTVNDTLTGGTVLPDFRQAVANIFPK
jgi:Uma2 family endonuclease